MIMERKIRGRLHRMSTKNVSGESLTIGQGEGDSNLLICMFVDCCNQTIFTLYSTSSQNIGYTTIFPPPLPSEISKYPSSNEPKTLLLLLEPLLRLFYPCYFILPSSFQLFLYIVLVYLFLFPPPSHVILLPNRGVSYFPVYTTCIVQQIQSDMYTVRKAYREISK
jgi:hypothetical protein